MKLRGPHLVALAIMAGIGGWMLTGDRIIGGQVDPTQPTIADREAKRTTEAFRVRVKAVEPSERLSALELRGRTTVDALVSVRAETGGTVEQRHFAKGQRIKSGDLLCVIEKGVRGTNMQQAIAKVAEAKADYEATKKLVQRGFATKTRLRQLKSALDASTAALASAEQEMGRTEIRAKVGGIVQEPMAQIGDNLAPGGVCVTLIDRDPMLFTGQIAERDITKVSVGMESEITLVDGRKVTGKVRYISSIADEKTRTFRTEIELPNSNGYVRDGLTAAATIPLKPTLAYEVDAAWLTLADSGEVGVRTVDDKNVVHFKPVTIIAQGETTVWVDGLAPGMKVITLGQNYVAAGETVVPVDSTLLEKAESGTSTHAPSPELEASK